MILLRSRLFLPTAGTAGLTQPTTHSLRIVHRRQTQNKSRNILFLFILGGINMLRQPSLLRLLKTRRCGEDPSSSSSLLARPPRRGLGGGGPAPPPVPTPSPPPAGHLEMDRKACLARRSGHGDILRRPSQRQQALAAPGSTQSTQPQGATIALSPSPIRGILCLPATYPLPTAAVHRGIL